jgi:hypothetical protein
LAELDRELELRLGDERPPPDLDGADGRLTDGLPDGADGRLTDGLLDGV